MLILQLRLIFSLALKREYTKDQFRYEILRIIKDFRLESCHQPNERTVSHECAEKIIISSISLNRLANKQMQSRKKWN